MIRRPRLVPLLAALMLIAVSLACSSSLSAAPAPAPTAAEAPGDSPSQPGESESPTEAAQRPTLAPPSVIEPTAIPAAAAIPERRRLTLDYPPHIRAGDSDLVRLTLEVDDQGNLTPTASVEGNVVTGGVVEIPNLYETHTVIVQARLDLAGVEVSPPGETSAQLVPGQTVSFFWSVSPREAGTFRGTLWLHLRFVDKVSGEELQRPILAQTIEIQGANLIGLSGNAARTAGLIGSVAGTVIGFPFLQDILKFLWKRRKK
jgi:hypothetical protein